MQKQLFNISVPINKVMHMGKAAFVKCGGSTYKVKCQGLLAQSFQVWKVTFSLSLDVAFLSSSKTDTSNSLSIKDTACNEEKKVFEPKYFLLQSHLTKISYGFLY